MPTAVDVARRFLELSVGDLSELADLYADEVVIEIPFAVPPVPTSRETTRDELRALFTRANAGRRYTHVSGVSIHELTDPQKVVVEYTLHGVLEPSGAEFDLAYIMVITVVDGLITHSRDYNDFVRAARVLGQTERLISFLSDGD